MEQQANIVNEEEEAGKLLSVNVVEGEGKVSSFTVESTSRKNKTIFCVALTLIVLVCILGGVFGAPKGNVSSNLPQSKNIDVLTGNDNGNTQNGIITSPTVPTVSTIMAKPTIPFSSVDVTYGPVPSSLSYCQLSQALTCSGAQLSQGYCVQQSGWCGAGPLYCGVGVTVFDAACFRFYQPNPYPAAPPALNGAYPSYPVGFSTGVGLNLFTNGCRMPGVIALTFDDGPGAFTAGLLDTLLSLNETKATFMLIGENINGYNIPNNGWFLKGYPDVVARMIKEGHVVGDHSWTHPYFSRLANTTAAIDTEIEQTSNAIYTLTGLRPKYFRFPYFDFAPWQIDYIMNTLNYIVLFDDLDTLDYEPVNQSGPNPNWLKNFNSKIVGSDPTLASFIVLNHDIYSSTASHVATAIATGVQAGYRFVTIEECIGFAAYK